MLDLHRLVLLRAVEEYGGITAAARELSYSHSAVSQQLALLELEAGATLLQKVGRTTRLTPVGLELVRNTEAILAAVERAESDLAASHDQPVGIVTLAVFASLGRSVLPAALTDLAERHPGLDVRVRVLDPEEAGLRLVTRRVDAVVSDSYPGTEVVPLAGFHARVIGRDTVRGYLPGGARRATLDELHTMPWVMEPSFSASTQWALRACRERGFEPFVAHESSDVLVHLRLVEAGVAAAFLPDLVVREGGGALTPSPDLPADQHRSILFLTRPGAEAHPALVAIEAAVARALESVSNTD